MHTFWVNEGEINENDDNLPSDFSSEFKIPEESKQSPMKQHRRSVSEPHPKNPSSPSKNNNKLTALVEGSENSDISAELRTSTTKNSTPPMETTIQEEDEQTNDIEAPPKPGKTIRFK